MIKNTTWAIASLIILYLNTVASGQVLDLQVARTANVSEAGERSVEAGFVAGDADHIGTRINYKMGESVLLMANLGITDFFSNEVSVGVGAMWQLSLDYPVDTAVKVSLLTAPTADDTILDFGVTGIASKEIEAVDGLSWYGTGGLRYVDAEPDGELVITFGGGATYSFNEKYDVYAGIDAMISDLVFYDDIVIGVGGRMRF